MLRRLPLIAVALLALTGCTHLGPGNDHGAKTSTVVYSVTGTGATTVSYAATGTMGEMTSRRDVSLPFKVTVHTVDHSQTLYKVTATASQSALSCAISVNGVKVFTTSAPAGKPVACAFLK